MDHNSFLGTAEHEAKPANALFMIIFILLNTIFNL